MVVPLKSLRAQRAWEECSVLGPWGLKGKMWTSSNAADENEAVLLLRLSGEWKQYSPPVVAAQPLSLFLCSHLGPRIHKGSKSERGSASSGW